MDMLEQLYCFRGGPSVIFSVALFPGLDRGNLSVLVTRHDGDRPITLRTTDPLLSRIHISELTFETRVRGIFDICYLRSMFRSKISIAVDLYFVFRVG